MTHFENREGVGLGDIPLGIWGSRILSRLTLKERENTILAFPELAPALRLIPKEKLIVTLVWDPKTGNIYVNKKMTSLTDAECKIIGIPKRCRQQERGYGHGQKSNFRLLEVGEENRIFNPNTNFCIDFSLEVRGRSYINCFKYDMFVGSMFRYIPPNSLQIMALKLDISSISKSTLIMIMSKIAPKFVPTCYHLPLKNAYPGYSNNGFIPATTVSYQGKIDLREFGI